MTWILYKLAIVFFAFGTSAAAATLPPAARSPEAVYYANAYADHYGLPRELVHAVITHESAWHRTAVSNMGATGLMQLMLATAEFFSVDHPTSIQGNNAGGVRYLAVLNQQFYGDLRMVLAAYYCGSRHIVRSGLDYHNREVVAYVAAMQKLYQREIVLHQPSSKRGTTDEP